MKRSWLLLALVGFAMTIVAPCSVLAAAKEYQASIISVNAPKTLRPGEPAAVTVTVKNIGKAAWQNAGKNYFSLYHWNPVRKRETVSTLASPAWPTPMRPTGIVKTIAPGETTTLIFPIHAPQQSGNVHASFVLCAEQVAWISYSPFTLDIQIIPDHFANNSPTKPSLETSSLTIPEWSAELVSLGGLEWQI